MTDSQPWQRLGTRTADLRLESLWLNLLSQFPAYSRCQMMCPLDPRRLVAGIATAPQFRSAVGGGLKQFGRSPLHLCWLTICVLCLLTSGGCGRQTSGQGASSSAQPRGFLRREHIDEAGNPHKYVLFVPHTYTVGSKPPVLMFLNGLGENGDDGVKQISNNFGIQAWESREFFPFIAIAPQCRKEGAWQAGYPDVKWAMQILDNVIQEYGADADRVYLTGVSSGGGGVWNVASIYPDRFAALVPLAGVGGDPLRIAESKIPVWDFYNDGDSKGLVDWNRKTRRTLIENGSSPIVTEYAAEGHDCWNRAYRTTAMFAWLQEQSHSRNSKAAPFKIVKPDAAMKTWRKSGTGTWKFESKDGDEILVGRADSSLALLISDTPSTQFELHTDFWLSDSAPCQFAIVSDKEPHDVEYLISIVPPKLGTGEIRNGRQDVLVTLDPSAERTLRAGAWNDVRIELRGDRLKVSLNGWPAANLKLEQQKVGIPFRCGLMAADAGSESRWRLIRTRVGNSNTN